MSSEDDFLNEIGEAWFDDPGEGHHAWAVIAECLDEGRKLPAWVLRYLRGIAGFVEQWDRARDGTDVLAEVLGFEGETPDVQTKPPKAKHDSLDVFSTVAGWRVEAHNAGTKLSLQACFERYINECLGGEGEEETLKTAYYRGKPIAEEELHREAQLIERGWPR